MTISQVGTDQPFSFADGGSGHACAFGSDPSAGDWDLLLVASNTVVSTPSGFTSLASRVVNMGAYIFGREAAGGESGTVTVTTSGNEPTAIIWTRLAGADAFDVAAVAGVDTSSGSDTPTATTATLAGTGEALVALGALSSIGGAAQTSPVWTGPTAGTTATNGLGGTGVRAYSALKLNVGTAAESASVAWSGDAAFNRYTLVVTLTEAAAGGQDGTGTAAGPVGAGTGAGTITNDGAGSAAGAAGTAAGVGTQPFNGTGTAAGPAGTASGVGTGPSASTSTSRAASALAALWFTESGQIERYAGQSGYGPLFGAPTTEPCAIDHGSKEIRTATGEAKVSTARVFLPLDTPDVSVGSRVTLPDAHGGEIGIVLQRHIHRSGVGTPDHVELVLT